MTILTYGDMLKLAQAAEIRREMRTRISIIDTSAAPVFSEHFRLSARDRSIQRCFPIIYPDVKEFQRRAGRILR